MAERSDAGGWLFRSSAVGTTSTKRCIAPCAPATPGTARTASTTLGSIGPRAPSSSNDVDSTARSMSPTTTVGAAMRVGGGSSSPRFTTTTAPTITNTAAATPATNVRHGARPPRRSWDDVRVANSSSVTGVAAPSIVLRSSSPRSDIFRHPQQCAQPCGAALEMVLHRRDPEPADVGNLAQRPPVAVHEPDREPLAFGECRRARRRGGARTTGRHRRPARTARGSAVPACDSGRPGRGSPSGCPSPPPRSSAPRPRPGLQPWPRGPAHPRTPRRTRGGVGVRRARRMQRSPRRCPPPPRAPSVLCAQLEKAFSGAGLPRLDVENAEPAPTEG